MLTSGTSGGEAPTLIPYYIYTLARVPVYIMYIYIYIYIYIYYRCSSWSTGAGTLDSSIRIDLFAKLCINILQWLCGQ